MQKDLFHDEDLEPKWKVLKVEKIMRNGREIVTYVLTEPINWKGPSKEKGPPWKIKSSSSL